MLSYQLSPIYGTQQFEPAFQRIEAKKKRIFDFGIEIDKLVFFFKLETQQAEAGSEYKVKKSENDTA